MKWNMFDKRSNKSVTYMGVFVSIAIVACSSDPASSSASGANSGSSSGSSSSNGSSGASGTPEQDSGTATPDAATPDAGVIDSGPVIFMDGGKDSGALDGGSGGNCKAAREQLLRPIASVSNGEITIISDTDGVKTVYVDASAGGTMASATNPRIYLNLETMSKVNVSDVDATTSMAWDLAIKRPILFTNSGDGGSGQGGAVFVSAAFDTVTTDSAMGKTFAKEYFLDSECNPQLDPTNAVKTTFDGWYDYNSANMQLTPKQGTWLVKGGGGKLYKIEIGSYYATSTGGTGMAGGRYLLKVKAL
jgi:hypothetical protein